MCWTCFVWFHQIHYCIHKSHLYAFLGQNPQGIISSQNLHPSPTPGHYKLAIKLLKPDGFQYYQKCMPRLVLEEIIKDTVTANDYQITLEHWKMLHFQGVGSGFESISNLDFHTSMILKNTLKGQYVTQKQHLLIWMFPKIGVKPPQNGWFIMENPI